MICDDAEVLCRDWMVFIHRRAYTGEDLLLVPMLQHHALERLCKIVSNK